MSKKLHQAREELKKLKFGATLSVLKSELRKKDELINNMKEQLLHVSTSKGSNTKHLTCLPTDNHQSPAVDDPHFIRSTDQHPQH